MDPTIVSLRGEYSAARQHELRATLRRVSTHPSVIIDATNLSYADDGCLSEFLRLRHTRAAAGLAPASVALDENRFGRVFRLLGLNEVFPLVGSGDVLSLRRPLRAVS